MSAPPEVIAAVRVALGELYPAEVLAGVHPTPGHPTAVRFSPKGTIPSADRIRAIRLARMHVNGHSYPTTCDSHSVTDRPDIWERCAKVPVRDALMGRTCGVA